MMYNTGLPMKMMWIMRKATRRCPRRLLHYFAIQMAENEDEHNCNCLYVKRRDVEEKKQLFYCQ